MQAFIIFLALVYFKLNSRMLLKFQIITCLLKLIPNFKKFRHNISCTPLIITLVEMFIFWYISSIKQFGRGRITITNPPYSITLGSIKLLPPNISNYTTFEIHNALHSIDKPGNEFASSENFDNPHGSKTLANSNLLSKSHYVGEKNVIINIGMRQQLRHSKRLFRNISSYVLILNSDLYVK